MIATLLVLASLGPCADLAACTAHLRASPELLPVARAALKRTPLVEGEPRAAPSKLDPKVLRGDTAFSIEVEQEGEHYVVRALSLHRPPSIFGRVQVSPQALPNPRQRARAIELALRSGIERAMEDLAAQLAEAAGQGRRTVKLSLKVNGLDGPTRQYLTESFLPCLKGTFDALGPVTEPHEIAGYLEDEIEYAPARDEPRDSLQWQVDRLKGLTLSLKAQCPAPAKVSPRFVADPINHGVLIEFR
jgi:hypothetical protein